jgi:hypothetical protein
VKPKHSTATGGLTRGVDNDRRGERPRRIELEQSVTLVSADGVCLSVRLKDLSRNGFKIEHSREDLVVGEIVTIRTSRSEARAQLQWVTETEAGGAFIDDAITPR